MLGLAQTGGAVILVSTLAVLLDSEGLPDPGMSGGAHLRERESPGELGGQSKKGSHDRDMEGNKEKVR